MKYDILTLDTQVFTTNSFDFDGGYLAQVKQFKDGPIGVVISSVVAREVRNQLAEKIRQAKDKFEGAVKDALHYGLEAKAAEGLELLTGTPRIMATKRIQAYLAEIGAPGTVPVNLITVDQLMDTYFKPAPPFAATGKKKAEFPDAVALLTLEAWAQKHGKKILAVSGDGDWSSYAEKSHYIDVVPDLKEALARLQAHAKEAAALVESFLAEIDQDGSEAAKAFEALLDPEVEGYAVDPGVETSQHAEVEGGELSLLEYHLAGDAPEFEFKVVRFGPWTVAASIELILKANASAYVSFYHWDSVDKESIPMGGVVAEKEVEDLRATVIATWEKDVLEGEWALDSVELISVDNPKIGYVEPDFGGDWEDED